MGPGSVRRGKVRLYSTTTILWIRKIYLDLWIKNPGRSNLCMILSICFIISPINLNWNMDKSLQICYLYALHWISDLIWDFRLVNLIELKSRSPWVPCNRQRRLKQKNNCRLAWAFLTSATPKFEQERYTVIVFA